MNERCNDDERDREKEKDPKECAHLTPRRSHHGLYRHSDRAASAKP